MSLTNTNEYYVTNRGYKIAKRICQDIKDNFSRKRAFAALICMDTLADYLYSQGYNIDISKNLYKILPINEEFEFTDIHCNGYFIDVIPVVNERFMLIPKNHFENGIAPDLYVAANYSTVTKKVKFAGCISSQDIDKSKQNEYYYIVRTDLLSAPDLVEETISIPRETAISDNEHDKFSELFISYIDGNISENDKKTLMRHLIECKECRDKFVDFFDYEMIALHTKQHPEVLADHTLGIVGATEVNDARYKNFEEITLEIDKEPDEYDEEENTVTGKTIKSAIEDPLQILYGKNNNKEIFDLINEIPTKKQPKSILPEIINDVQTETTPNKTNTENKIKNINPEYYANGLSEGVIEQDKQNEEPLFIDFDNENNSEKTIKFEDISLDDNNDDLILQEENNLTNLTQQEFPTNSNTEETEKTSENENLNAKIIPDEPMFMEEIKSENKFQNEFLLSDTAEDEDKPLFLEETAQDFSDLTFAQTEKDNNEDNQENNLLILDDNEQSATEKSDNDNVLLIDNENDFSSTQTAYSNENLSQTDEKEENTIEIIDNEEKEDNYFSEITNNDTTDFDVADIDIIDEFDNEYETSDDGTRSKVPNNLEDAGVVASSLLDYEENNSVKNHQSILQNDIENDDLLIIDDNEQFATEKSNDDNILLINNDNENSSTQITSSDDDLLIIDDNEQSVTEKSDADDILLIDNYNENSSTQITSSDDDLLILDDSEQSVTEKSDADDILLINNDNENSSTQITSSDDDLLILDDNEPSVIKKSDADDILLIDNDNENSSDTDKKQHEENIYTEPPLLSEDTLQEFDFGELEEFDDTDINKATSEHAKEEIIEPPKANLSEVKEENKEDEDDKIVLLGDNLEEQKPNSLEEEFSFDDNSFIRPAGISDIQTNDEDLIITDDEDNSKDNDFVRPASMWDFEDEFPKNNTENDNRNSTEEKDETDDFNIEDFEFPNDEDNDEEELNTREETQEKAPSQLDIVLAGINKEKGKNTNEETSTTPETRSEYNPNKNIFRQFKDAITAKEEAIEAGKFDNIEDSVEIIEPLINTTQTAEDDEDDEFTFIDEEEAENFAKGYYTKDFSEVETFDIQDNENQTDSEKTEYKASEENEDNEEYEEYEEEEEIIDDSAKDGEETIDTNAEEEEKSEEEENSDEEISDFSEDESKKKKKIIAIITTSTVLAIAILAGGGLAAKKFIFDKNQNTQNTQTTENADIIGGNTQTAEDDGEAGGLLLPGEDNQPQAINEENSGLTIPDENSESTLGASMPAQSDNSPTEATASNQPKELQAEAPTQQTEPKAVEQPLQKAAQTTSNPQAATNDLSASKISWGVGATLAASPEFKQYLQTTGKVIKRNLNRDLQALQVDKPTGVTKLLFILSETGKIESTTTIKSCGSKQIDDFVLQSITQSLQNSTFPTLSQEVLNANEQAVKSRNIKISLTVTY